MKKTIVFIMLLSIAVSLKSQEQTINGNLIVNGAIQTKERLSLKSQDGNIDFANHNLYIGTPVGRYAHNYIHLRPGGATEGILYSELSMYLTSAPDVYIKRVRLHTNGISFFNGGNVGIGTESPQSKLDVRGKIIADEVEIKINQGADLVFESDYNLRPLSEIENFVKENKHLPDIPSEKEMREKGLNLNNMQIKLLQKIEELTLYVIELKKENENIKEELEKLRQGIW